MDKKQKTEPKHEGTVLNEFSIFYGKKEKKYKLGDKFKTESKEVLDYYKLINKIK